MNPIAFSNINLSLTVAAILALVVVYALVRLALTLLLGGSTGTVATTVLTAFAVVALVRARPVLGATGFVPLVALIGCILIMLTGAVRRVTLLFL
jgi:hypothetical protein